MGICDNPDRLLNQKKKFRKRKSSYSTGLNAKHRLRGRPFMTYDVPNQTVHQPGKVIIPAPDWPIPIGVKTREMSDTHGFIQHWYNPCVNEKFDGGEYNLPTISDSEGPIISFTNRFSNRQMIRDSYPFLTIAQLDELALKSQDKLSKVVGTNVSLANFLLELIQLITGNIKIIRRFANLYDRMMKAFHEAFERFRKQGHKETAAYWLAWNFAIKPFLSDLRALLCSVSHAYKRMDWLRKHNHQVIYLSYRRKDIGDLISFDPNEWIGGWTLCTINHAEPPGNTVNGEYRYQVRFSDIEVTYVARSKIFLEIPDKYLDEATGMGTLWAAYQGLTNPVGVIWEAIPFSWLIDYFLSYRARLWQTAYDFNPYNAGVTVLGYGHSFNIKMTVDARIYNTTQSQSFSGWGVKYELYSRAAGLPFPEEATLFRVPDNWYQASIIGAIVIGRLPKRRRREQ